MYLLMSKLEIMDFISVKKLFVQNFALKITNESNVEIKKIPITKGNLIYC